VLYAKAFAPITTSTGVDLETGRLLYNPETAEQVGRITRGICPASPGGKDWQPSAYSPKSGLLYIPHNNLCQDAEPAQTSYIAGTPYVGMDVRMYAGPGGHRGELSAWDVAGGREVWTIKEDFPAWSGAAVTAGELRVLRHHGRLVQSGACPDRGAALAVQGRLRHRRPAHGLSRTRRQAVRRRALGVGGWAGAIVAGGLDARDGTAALGFVNAMGDLPQHTSKGGMLYVFALP
jgi:hypothetical protein